MKLQTQDGDPVPMGYALGDSLASLILVLVTTTTGAVISSYDRMFCRTKQEIVEAFIKHTAGELSMSEIKKITVFRMIRIISTKALGNCRSTLLRRFL